MKHSTYFFITTTVSSLLTIYLCDVKGTEQFIVIIAHTLLLGFYMLLDLLEENLKK